MKRRRRYVAFEAAAGFGKQDVYGVTAALSRALGVDRAEVRVIVYDEESRMGLLRSSHYFADGLKKAMARDGSSLKVVGVSGTIRAAKRKFFSEGQKKNTPRPE